MSHTMPSPSINPTESHDMPPQGIGKLHVSYFRNHHQRELVVTSSLVVLTGPNGAGKTSILEAISLLSPGRGLRSAKLSQMTNRESNAPWIVSAQVETDIGPIHMGSTLDSAKNISPDGVPVFSERRSIRINQMPARNQSALSEWLNVVWVVPAMARLFDESASVRRKFIDRMVLTIDPSHSERVNRYEHFLRERSLLLKDNSCGGQGSRAWLDTLEQRLSEDGVAITQARAQLVRQLTDSQRLIPQSPFPRFFAQMRGNVEDWCRQLSALEAEECLKTHLKQSRSQDAQSGGSVYGPHRGDLYVDHLDKQMPADLCSTGEQKMLLLALTLAYTYLLGEMVTLDRNPLTLLLLDDVVAHLDEEHRHHLFQELKGRIQQGVPLQVWMTGTDLENFSYIHDVSQMIVL